MQMELKMVRYYIYSFLPKFFENIFDVYEDVVVSLLVLRAVFELELSLHIGSEVLLTR